jgi:hypothetical protein
MDRGIEGWLEHTAVGALYVMACVFLALDRLDVHDLATIGPHLQLYAPYIVPLLLGSSYLCGTTIALLMPVMASLLPERGRRLVRGARFPALADESGATRFVELVSRGSDELIVAVKGSWRTMRLFQGLLLAIPTVSTAFAIWARNSPVRQLVAPVLVFGMVATVIVYIAQRVQYASHYSVVLAARNELRTSSAQGVWQAKSQRE